MEVGPPVPQCQPGWQEKPRLPHSPGLSVRPRFVWFRGSAPSTPTHPSGLSAPSRIPQESVGNWREGKG